VVSLSVVRLPRGEMTGDQGHSVYMTLNWRARGIGELTLDAKKIQSGVKYRKVSLSV